MKNFTQRCLTEFEVRRTFETGYIGHDIYAVYPDGTEVLVHGNGKTLDWCLNAMRHYGCVFYYD